MSPTLIGPLGATKVWENELVNGVATITSAIFKVEHVIGYFSAWLQVTSVAGVPTIRAYYQMSYDNVAAHFATPNGFADIVAVLNVETVQIYSFSPPYLPYIRFLITGNAGNPADSLVTMHLCVQ